MLSNHLSFYKTTLAPELDDSLRGRTGIDTSLQDSQFNANHTVMVKKFLLMGRKCDRFFAAAADAKLLQSCPTLCDPIEGSPPGSIPGSLQARILEWVAILSPMHDSEK